MDRIELTSRAAVASAVGWILPKRHAHDTRLSRNRDAGVRAEWDRPRMALLAKAILRCGDFLRDFSRKRVGYEKKRQFEMLRNELSTLFVRISAVLSPYGRFLVLRLPGDEPVHDAWESLQRWMIDECRQSLLAGK
jgi:hypothetical protein